MKTLFRFTAWLWPMLFLFACPGRQQPPGDPALLAKPLEELTAAEMAQIGVVIETNLGRIQIRFYPHEAPATVRNFIKLVRMGYYDGTKVYMVKPGHSVHLGDHLGDGKDNPGWNLKYEPNARKLRRGSVVMFHPPYYYDEGGSLFFIMLMDDPTLEGGYAVFGEVREGMPTVDRIAELPRKAPSGKPGAPVTEVVLTRVYLELAAPAPPL